MQHHVYAISAVCAAMGVKNAIICPGSRSAPLVKAFVNQKEITCHSIVDERSAAFFALGMAREDKFPVVLICTSGTAALNFFPAIAEAFYQKIPLLILTADRPPELLNQQDGQMIMQKNMYGKHVLASYELPCFETNKVDFTLTEKLAIKAINKTISNHNFGPVHINIPLREPLYDKVKFKPYKLTEKHLIEPIKSNYKQLQIAVTEVRHAYGTSTKKLIIIGSSWVNNQQQELIKKLTEIDKSVVVIADVVSNQQTSSSLLNFDAVLQYANAEILKKLKPDFILSFGGPLVSKALKTWLKSSKPKHHFRIQTEQFEINTYNNLTKYFVVNTNKFLENFTQEIYKSKKPFKYKNLWISYSKKVKLLQLKYLNKTNWFETSATKNILHLLEPTMVLHLGNSSVIRHVSWLGLPKTNLTVYGNRGTSGIDGLISTAFGSAKANQLQKHVLLIGDLSFWYDQNAFWQNYPLPQNLIIIVYNNQAGGIFNWIDGPAEDKNLINYFTTPHQREIKPFVKQLKIAYHFANTFSSLDKEIKTAFAKNKLAVIELDFTNSENFKHIKAFKNLSLTT